MDDPVKLFCMVDDFWKKFEPEWKKLQLGQEIKKVRRPAGLSLSEVLLLDRMLLKKKGNNRIGDRSVEKYLSN